MDGLPLGLKIDPGNPVLIDRLQQLELYPFQRVNAYAEARYGWDRDTQRANELTLKRLFSLELLDEGYDHIPDDVADKLWHACIVHTHWYAAFCEAIFEDFLHHEPVVTPAPRFAADRTEVLVQALYDGEPNNLLSRSNCRVIPRPQPRRQLEPSAAFTYAIRIQIGDGRLAPRSPEESTTPA